MVNCFSINILKLMFPHEVFFFLIIFFGCMHIAFPRIKSSK